MKLCSLWTLHRLYACLVEFLFFTITLIACSAFPLDYFSCENVTCDLLGVYMCVCASVCFGVCVCVSLCTLMSLHKMGGRMK